MNIAVSNKLIFHHMVRWTALLPVCLFAFFLLVAGSTASHAQMGLLGGSNEPEKTPIQVETEALNNFLEQARKSGARVVVIDPNAKEEEKPVEEMSMAGAFSTQTILRARKEFRHMVRRAAIFAPTFFTRLGRMDERGGFWWLLQAILTAVGGLFVGNLVFRRITKWGRQKWAPEERNKGLKRTDVLSIILRRAVFMLFSFIVAMLVAFLVAIIFDTEHEASRRTIFIIVTTYTVYRIMRSVVFWNFFLPDHSQHRFVNLTDDEAKSLFRDWAVALMVVALIVGIGRFVGSLDLNHDFENVVRIVALLICALIFAGISIWHRHELFKILLGYGEPSEKPRWLQILAFAAMPAILAYLATAWVISSIRLTLGLPGGFLPLAAPFIIFVAAVFTYATALLLIGRWYERREALHRQREISRVRAERRAWFRAQDAKRIADGMSEEQRDLLEEGEEMQVQVIERPKPNIQPYNPVFKSFLEGVVEAIILVVSLGELSRLWGADIGREGHPLAATLDVILVVYIAVAAYRAVNKYIDMKILAEGGRLETDDAAPGDTDSEGGTGESRVATLLPIFRNIFTIFIGVVALVSVLSYLGVNVGPLFAGAGVVGIAIGFGAQALIRDIFSGAFYLLDDAFRKGEYIEIGEIRGVVEKISLRSFQLRHHLGALHTVPFGEIRQLTNYSRDWVMMKLPMRVTYDTDVEKVRKLIKKLGQELLKDDVVGPLFLQPLKSQGVYKMEDSAMIIRVKFMTRPGDQFITRKVVFAAVRELFEREGVQFAHKEVTVHLADNKKTDELTEDQKKAIAGSVLASQEEEDLQNADKKKAAPAM